MGHPVGDTVLADFAVLLMGAVRSRDAVARVGGDEFVVVTVGDLPELLAEADDLMYRAKADAAHYAVTKDGPLPPVDS